MSNVFFSHSHSDREIASHLEQVLRQNGAQVFYDQRAIEPGDDLPVVIESGIQNCTVFLLLWSLPASQSKYVNLEWNLAYNRMKKIIPYKLDSTPLPDALENLVHINIEDQYQSNSQLLTSVLGKDFSLSPDNIFPGSWRVILQIPKVSRVIHNIDLMPNGQISGDGWIDTENNLLGLAAKFGGFFKPELVAKMRITGEWKYDDFSQLLSLYMSISHLGQEYSESINIQMTGYESGVIHGSGPYGRSYTFERI